MKSYIMYAITRYGILKGRNHVTPLLAYQDLKKEEGVWWVNWVVRSSDGQWLIFNDGFAHVKGKPSDWRESNSHYSEDDHQEMPAPTRAKRTHIFWHGTRRSERQIDRMEIGYAARERREYGNG